MWGLNAQNPVYSKRKRAAQPVVDQSGPAKNIVIYVNTSNTRKSVG